MILDYERLISSMTPEEVEELDLILSAEITDQGEVHRVLWEPIPGRQTDAVLSLADFLYYGGQPGGGKTMLIIGLALTAHQRSLICRREYGDLAGIHQELESIIGHRRGFNEGKNRWRIYNQRPRLIEFGAAAKIGDEQGFQGRAHDLKAFDEVAHFAESQFRFFSTWNRSPDPNQRCRVVAAGNPALDATGLWVNDFWAPWLDPKYGNPARPGELRWFARLDDKDVEVEGPAPFEFGGETIYPKSRTFIPAGLEDNPYYGSDYKATLQALPEPWRTILLKGDYTATIKDDPWQVIPTEHVVMAQERWKQRRKPDAPMDALGVDPNRGGDDKLVLSPRYGNWFDELQIFSGEEIKSGPAVAAKVLPIIDPKTVVNVDVIGIGSSAFDAIDGAHHHAYALNGSSGTKERDRLGIFGFVNKRALWHWRLREALDPDTGDDLALPPGNRLLEDLTAPRWRPTTRGIQVEEKDQIRARIGRSPDEGDAVMYANAMEHVQNIIVPAQPTRESYWRF